MTAGNGFLRLREREFVAVRGDELGEQLFEVLRLPAQMGQIHCEGLSV